MNLFSRGKNWSLPVLLLTAACSLPTWAQGNDEKYNALMRQLSSPTTTQEGARQIATEALRQYPNDAPKLLQMVKVADGSGNSKVTETVRKVAEERLTAAPEKFYAATKSLSENDGSLAREAIQKLRGELITPASTSGAPSANLIEKDMKVLKAELAFFRGNEGGLIQLNGLNGLNKDLLKYPEYRKAGLQAINEVYPASEASEVTRRVYNPKYLPATEGGRAMAEEALEFRLANAKTADEIAQITQAGEARKSYYQKHFAELEQKGIDTSRLKIDVDALNAKAGEKLYRMNPSAAQLSEIKRQPALYKAWEGASKCAGGQAASALVKGLGSL